MDNLSAAAGRFTRGKIIDIQEFGNGNINHTFLVTETAEGTSRFILQRLNTRVFRRPELVMLNMRIATEHILRRLEDVTPYAVRRWEVPLVLLTDDGRDHWRGPDGSFWRSISFIEDAESFDTIRDEDHAEEVGHALGIFHTLLSDLPFAGLTDTLEGFHITPRYLRHYDEVMTTHGVGASPELNYCIRFVTRRRAMADVLENARVQGKLFPRTIHGDPKVNNILMDASTMQAVSIVDLDTVKPGLVHYDIGDCLRSGCNPLGEETEEWEAVRFDTDLCRAVLKGYLSAAREFLTEDDFSYLYDSIRLLAFELGLRFFTDYIEGDVYFKAGRPGHNLSRAMVQFRLTESIESQKTAIDTIIRDHR